MDMWTDGWMNREKNIWVDGQLEKWADGTDEWRDG